MSKAERKLLLPALIVAAVLGLLFICNRSFWPIKARAQLQKPAVVDVSLVRVQFDRDSFGLAMVDKTRQTIWLYRINSRGPAYKRLELLAARSFRYDKMLQQYNTAEPKPEQVRLILENLGRQWGKKSKNEQADSAINSYKENEPNISDL